MKNGSFCLAFGVLLIIAQPALSQTVEPGFRSETLPRCDDCFTPPVSLPFSLDYFGNTYNSTFVSSNGYITFNSQQGAFTPTSLGASYVGQPLIAPFFADVDTRPLDGGFTQYGSGLFGGRSAWGATWTDVGYYSFNTDKTNTFQTLLVDRSDVRLGDFDIYFNYDRILWETGDENGGVSGFGGTSAAAGFNAGLNGLAGTYYELPGSLVNGAFLDGGPNSLVANSNIGQAGRYLFSVRNGQVTVPGAVPEPSTWATMILGFGVIGGAMRSAKRKRTMNLSYAK